MVALKTHKSLTVLMISKLKIAPFTGATEIICYRDRLSIVLEWSLP